MTSPLYMCYAKNAYRHVQRNFNKFFFPMSCVQSFMDVESINTFPEILIGTGKI